MSEKQIKFNLKDELDDKDMQIIKKLECEIHNEFYTGAEYYRLKENLGIYYSFYKEEPEQKYKKPLKYGVTKEEFDYVHNTFNRIDNKYAEILDEHWRKIDFDTIWFTEKQHVRDKLISFLEEKILNDIQKQQLFDIVMNMKETTLLQKERFILYYGLDREKIKIHSCSQIAKIQNCTSSNIRQTINKIKSRFIRLSDEEIDKIREIIKEE